MGFLEFLQRSAMTGHAIVLQGDARALPLPDASVDLIVTSPPYFGLRSYQDGGEHYAGQIGSEATPAEWVAAMLACTAEWMRVLKPAGSMFVNLGDKYSSHGGHTDRGATSRLDGRRAVRQQGRPETRDRCGDVRDKSLMGLPWRYALGCIDQLGLILRAEIVWSKPNGLPESVTDRVRRSHEQWFHLVKSPRYFSAIDEIREPYAPATANRYAAGYGDRKLDEQRLTVGLKLGGQQYGENPLGKLPGSVWEVPSEPLSVPAHLGVDHFAAFPTAWPKRLIQGWAPSGICTGCGEGRRPIRAKRQDVDDGGLGRGFNGAGYAHTVRKTTIIGYSCGCTPVDPLARHRVAPTTPAVVLDPFGGTGTTALVAKALDRIGITVDLSHDYCRLAAWRTGDRAQLAKVLEVSKPPVEIDGQHELFEMLG